MKLKTLLLLTLAIVLITPGWAQEMEHVFTYEASEDISVHTLSMDIDTWYVDGTVENDETQQFATVDDAWIMNVVADAVLRHEEIVNSSYDGATETYTIQSDPAFDINLFINEVNHELINAEE